MTEIGGYFSEWGKGSWKLGIGMLGDLEKYFEWRGVGGHFKVVTGGVKNFCG